jgi:Uma2 family endonuclease
MTGGVHLPDGSLFGPDATYASPERWGAADRSQTFAHVVPDAAFEILSKSDRIATTRRKLEAYLRNGVRLAVLIDCRRRHVYVGREGEAEPRNLGWIDRLDCEPAMPGFTLDLAMILAAAELLSRQTEPRASD